MNIFENKPRYIIVFFRKEYNVLVEVKKIKVNNLNKILKGKNKQYIIDIEHPSVIKGNKRFYFVNIDNGTQYHLHEVEQLMNPEELDLVIGNKIIRELTAGVIDNKKEKIFLIIVGALIGGLLMTAIMLGVMSNKIEDLLTPSQPNVPIIPTYPASILSLIQSIWRV